NSAAAALATLRQRPVSPLAVNDVAWDTRHSLQAVIAAGMDVPAVGSHSLGFSALLTSRGTWLGGFLACTPSAKDGSATQPLGIKVEVRGTSARVLSPHSSGDSLVFVLEASADPFIVSLAAVFSASIDAMAFEL